MNSATDPDWSREQPQNFWDPARRLLLHVRRYQSISGNGLWARWRRKFHVAGHIFWSAVSGADIPLNSHIEGGLRLPHPNGVVIHPAAKIGPNCLIFQQVTIGKSSSSIGAPQIGGHVDIGAGAKILGGITIGDHVKIGANAVVLCDVPAGATAVGVPARVLLTPRDCRGADINHNLETTKPT
ncbi:serine O-acetyltransferase [Aeoliella straminimaris]|uniref:serine O-acetyltransferase n=1 Tax=Aeoliella straminimaris TaxID=2954799 RepID=UPI003CC6AF76